MLSFIILNVYIGVKAYQKSQYTDHFFRLHVVANSNSVEDQIEKLKVYEVVSSYVEQLKKDGITNKSELLNVLTNNHQEIISLANQTLNKDNITYGSELKIGKINYEEKQNIQYDMPAGNYDSLQIILGKGEGKNIWSLIFPNEVNIDQIKNYDTILPGISHLYEETQETTTEPQYGFKLFEIIESWI